MDPDDSNMQLVLKQTSDSSVADHNRKHARRKKPVDEYSQQQERNAGVLNTVGQETINDDEKYAPRIPMYLRPVESQDIPEILKIYNHYISNTIYSPEMDPIGKQEIKQRINDISDAKLPFLVAIHRRMKSARGNRPQEMVRTLVGFGFIDDYQDIKSMYR